MTGYTLPTVQQYGFYSDFMCVYVHNPFIRCKVQVLFSTVLFSFYRKRKKLKRKWNKNGIERKDRTKRRKKHEDETKAKYIKLYTRK